MKKSVFKVGFSYIFLMTIIVWQNCAPSGVKYGRIHQPSIRIGILEGRNSVDFKIPGRVTFISTDGDFVLRGLEGGHWRVEVLDATPATYRYRLSVTYTRDRFEAEEVVQKLKNMGLEAIIKKYPLEPRWEIPYVINQSFQVLLDEVFDNEILARFAQENLKNKIQTEIFKEVKSESKGILRFKNLDNQYSFDSKKPIQILTNEVEIANVEVGKGFHWANNQTRNYTGTIEFILDRDGLLTVVNELPIEEYLKGVVPSEMPSRFPLEALKAQAVAARVEALAKRGLRHPNDPYDLCDDVHCQVFSGKTRETAATNRAVSSTKGIVMVYRNNLVHAFYSAVCGGHTEDNENVWFMKALPYLRGRLDVGKPIRLRLSTALQNENSLKKWIDAKPNVFCNTLKENIPDYLLYSQKYFRWKFEIDRGELQKIIEGKTGESFGDLIDIIPKRRGVSGRLIEIEVIGSKKKFTITGELNIRQSLSKTTLYSACFYVEKKGKHGGLPEKFIFKGAGWGHGVGMCQVGAAVMARLGYKFDRILKHYYKGITLERVY